MAATAWLSPANAADSQVVLNIEPTRENPRNSEGSFVTLKSGRIVFMFTQFYGGARDNSPARVVAIHSDDKGATWSREPKIVVDNQAGENVMSVSLLRLTSGKIALLYVVKNSWLDCRPRIQLSSDEGETWSEPKLVVAAPGYFVLNNDRVIQLASGRLIVPVAFHRSRDTDPHSSKSFDSRAIAMWYLSDDEGRTWREADTWWALPEQGRTGMQEPGVLEIAPGNLICWARTDQGEQYGCASKDHGKSWSAPKPTTLKSPASPASIKMIPGSKDLLAVWNDHSGRFPYPKGKRTPLVLGVSSDQTASWRVLKVLEDDPEGWYCYTAIHFVGDSVLLGYCAGDSKIGGLNRLRIRKISLDSLK